MMVSKSADKISALSQFSVSVSDSTATIEVIGEVDLSNVRQFESVLDYAIVSGCRRIVVSYRHVTYIDSTSLHALVKKAKLARETGLRFSVAVPTGSYCAKLFRVAGVDHVLTVVEEAAHSSVS